jgi:SAM-dependent methyltransferase
MLVLDVGCGIGGPGAWIRANAGCMVVGVDVMEDAARGARLLFPESRIAVASSRSLPFAEHTFDAAIALGVLETIADKRSALREIGRVLATGARLCVYTYLWAEEEVPEAPVADRFQTCTAFEEEIDAVGLERIDARVFNGFGTTPGSWREAARVAHREVERLHGSDPLFIEAVAEMNKIARLISQRAVQPWLYVLRGP